MFRELLAETYWPDWLGLVALMRKARLCSFSPFLLFLLIFLLPVHLTAL